MAGIKKSEYKKTECLVLENEYLAVTVLPYGGRIVSIFNKSIQKEFLIQQDRKKYNIGEYDSDYVKAGPAGFDDMFPTIVRSFFHLILHIL